MRIPSPPGAPHRLHSPPSPAAGARPRRRAAGCVGGSTGWTFRGWRAGGRVRLQGRLAPPAAKWTEQGNVQVALYMRAVEELLGLEAAGGFYQPLSGGDLRARGVLDGESGVEIECVRGEVREHAEVQRAAGAGARDGARGGGGGGTRRAGAPPAHVRVSGRLHVSDDLPVRGMTQLSFDERAAAVADPRQSRPHDADADRRAGAGGGTPERATAAGRRGGKREDVGAGRAVRARCARGRCGARADPGDHVHRARRGRAARAGARALR